jgi:hypothetical protein
MHNMKKKIFALSSVMLAGSLVFSGCTSTPEPKPTASPTVTVAPAVNPLATYDDLLKETSFENSVKVNIIQVGTGYPTEEQLRVWGETDAEAPTEYVGGDSPLVENRRVVALKYDVTNSTSRAVNVKQFAPKNGYFPEMKSLENTGKASDSEFSVHAASLGVPSFPASFNPEDEQWMLQPGQTASWGLDWLVPEEYTDSPTLVMTQNLSLGADTWASDNTITMKVNEIKEGK